MKKLLVALVFLMTIPFAARADELIMFHNPGCPYCNKFMAEMVETGKYEESEYGKELPLTVIDLTVDYSDELLWLAQAIRDGRLKTRVRYTPTFVIWIGDRGHGIEVGSFVGYGSPESFNRVLQKTLEKAPDSIDLKN